MHKFEGMLLFSDLDGTVFDSNTELPKRNIDGISYFKEQGGRFAVATGRSHISLAKHKDLLGVNAPCVVLNGCGVFDYSLDKFIYSVFLDNDAKEAVKYLATKHKDINTVVFLDDDTMAATQGVDHLPPCFDSKVVPGIRSDIKDVVSRDWFKVVFVGELQELKVIANECTSINIGNTGTVFAGDDMFEFLPAGVTKGDGMVALAKSLNTDLSKVFAVGDFYNDQEMLKYAGISAVAGQAPDDVKEVADYTACTCDEGTVGWFVEKLDTLF